MSNDILALANAAAATATNMTEASKGGGGGGDYTPPPTGKARARLVGYVETGKHEKNVGPGKPKQLLEQVKLIFELSGPNYEPKVLDDGTKLPHRITIDLNAGKNYGALNEKSGLYKLFKRLNYKGTATHISQLLGEAYLVEIKHDEKVGSDGKTRTYVRVKDESGYLIEPPRFYNPIDQTTTEVPVDPPISSLRLFMWNASPEYIGKMWDTLFIDGEYPERKNDKGEVTAPAKSKNVLQNEVKAAVNFINSPIFQYLQTNGVQMDLGAAGNAVSGATVASTPTPNTAQPAASDDPLAAL